MSKILSIFGAYADRLQVMVDKSLDKFAPTWFQNYFDMGVPQMSLTYTSVIGRSRIEAAASIIARDSKSPLRSRAALEKLTGEIPAISEKFGMSEQDYRDFLTLQQINAPDAVKKQQLLDLMFNDVKNVGDAAMKRLDYVSIEGVSTGAISITIDNNPDGAVNSVAIDLGLTAGQKTNAAITWATAATATPITDIETVVELGKAKGRSFAKVLMAPATWQKFRRTKEVLDYLTGFKMLAKGTVVATRDVVNEFLVANDLPIIEVVDVSIGIEKNGIITASNPFSATNAVFVPAGKLGVIKNALAIEELKPVEKVKYAKFNNALISKWSDNEPFQEYTKVEFNAFPAIEAIDGIHLLSTTVAF